MNHILRRGRPSELAVAASGIVELVAALEQLDDVEPHSLMVLRHGTVIAEGWWAPYSSGRVHLLYSLSKTFTGTALALAVKEGHVGLDDPVVRYFPEIDPAGLDDRVRRLRIRHLAAMASGHLEDTWHRGPAADPEHPVRAFLAMPPESEPGTLFAYNQSATYTLAMIVQRVSGTTVNDYLQERLLRRIGVGPTSWHQHPAGQDLGFSGLHATTEDLARLGQLYLQEGRWDGELVLPAEWTTEASRVQVATDRPAATGEPPSPDWAQGYGFQMWSSRHGYRGDGAYGQYCLVLPAHHAVVAMTGQTIDMQAALDAVWTYLLPAFDAATGCSPDADEELAARLQGLELPAAPGRPSPSGAAADWLASALVPVAPAEGDANGVALTAARLVEDGGAWHLLAEQDGDRLVAPLATSWVRARWDGGGAPVVSSGGFLDEGTLEVALVFLETPHRLLVRASLRDGTVAARWVTVPLHALPLRKTCSPATAALAR